MKKAMAGAARFIYNCKQSVMARKCSYSVNVCLRTGELGFEELMIGEMLLMKMIQRQGLQDQFSSVCP